jgi:hypothetical protein
MPVIGKPPQNSNGASPTSFPEKPVIQEEQANQGKPERANARTPVRRNGKRIITRNAFEIYEDQMDKLRKISLEEKMNGKLGSMSAMVREAIDTYLQKSPLENNPAGSPAYRQLAFNASQGSVAKNLTSLAKG